MEQWIFLVIRYFNGVTVIHLLFVIKVILLIRSINKYIEIEVAVGLEEC